MKSDRKNDARKTRPSLVSPEMERMRHSLDIYRKACDVLSESETQYRTLVENLQVGVFRSSPSMRGKFLQVNPVMVRTLGYGDSRELMDLQVCSVYQNIEDRRTVLRDLKEQGIVRNRELQMRRRDGSTLWVECTARAQCDETGDIKWIDGIIVDISDRKQVEQALRESEEKYRMLVENANEAIFSVDYDGNLLFLNHNTANYLGGTVEELIGKPLRGFLDPQTADERIRVCRRVIRTGHGEVHEWAHHNADETLWFRIAIQPLRQVGYNTRAAMVIAHDVTRRRNAEAALHKAHRKLTNAREAERRHLARELHDAIGQSLIVLKLGLRNVMQICDEGQYEKAHQALNESAEKCDELVGQVRSLCYGLYPPSLESLGLQHALKQLSRHCGQHVRCECECSKELRDARLDPETEIALFRIAQEASNNALRHSKSERLSFRLRRHKDRVALSIIDHGKGFDVEQNRNGLGLTTMSERAQGIGGTLKIFSEPGKTIVEAIAPLRLQSRRKE